MIIGFLVLRPSFDLALTGDDYLGLWRYQFYINGWGGETLSNKSYFFTDYGPMDMLTAIIHHFVGFRHQIYYIVSFVLRTLAALSFLWPVYRLSKSKWAAVIAAAFFMITTTGLEATDWSFNMPSYVAIALTNLALGCFVTQAWFFAPIFFVLAIISQPIRTMFLPILMIGLEIYSIVINFNLRKLFWGLSRIGVYIFLIATLLKYTSYGGAVSLRGSSVLAQNLQQVIQLGKDGNYKILVTPISQIGRLILPNNFLYQRIEIWGLPRTFRQVVVTTFSMFLIGLVIIRSTRWQFLIGVIVAFGWTTYVWRTFMNPAESLIQPFELLTYLFGGYVLIILTTVWISLKKQENLRLGLFLAVLFTASGFILFWVRTPGTVYEITGRYLIVSGAGLAWLVGMLTAVGTRSRSIILLILVGILFSLHAKTSYRYLYHLSEVRGIELTDRLRGSIKRATNFGNPDVALVFYFEGDDPEILQHSFIFGFPVISHYQFDIDGPWYNIAPTNIWAEVESAYVDGQSLKRFMPGPWKPVALENIYAYRLENRNLVDVTEEKREKLKQLKLK